MHVDGQNLDNRQAVENELAVSARELNRARRLPVPVGLPRLARGNGRGPDHRAGRGHHARLALHLDRRGHRGRGAGGRLSRRSAPRSTWCRSCRSAWWSGSLLVFGLQWLRKAILRASGFKAIHDEEAAFRKEVQAAREHERDHRGARLVRLHARLQGRLPGGFGGRVHRADVRASRATFRSRPWGRPPPPWSSRGRVASPAR